ncbi:MAG: hypothetical protein QOC70_1877 [Verrucomicrobiota bacterium]|jgi:hypothetical protein
MKDALQPGFRPAKVIVNALNHRETEAPYEQH